MNAYENVDQMFCYKRNMSKSVKVYSLHKKAEKMLFDKIPEAIAYLTKPTSGDSFNSLILPYIIFRAEKFCLTFNVFEFGYLYLW